MIVTTIIIIIIFFITQIWIIQQSLTIMSAGINPRAANTKCISKYNDIKLLSTKNTEKKRYKIYKSICKMSKHKQN